MGEQSLKSNGSAGVLGEPAPSNSANTRKAYVPPVLTKKRSVARVTLQTGGAGQSTSPVITSPPATP